MKLPEDPKMAYELGRLSAVATVCGREGDVSILDCMIEIDYKTGNYDVWEHDDDAEEGCEWDIGGRFSTLDAALAYVFCRHHNLDENFRPKKGTDE